MKKPIYDFSKFSMSDYIESQDEEKLAAIDSRIGIEIMNKEFEKCESPIEKMLLFHLLAIAPEDMGITQQVEVCVAGDFRRMDFIISLEAPRRNGSKPLFVVETDGSHHNSEENVMDDKRRDRDVLGDLGLMVVRFTGKEVYSDADMCAWEVTELFYSMKQSLMASIFNIDPKENPLTKEYTEHWASYKKKIREKKVFI